jgi:hypothetical protein
LDGGKRSGHLVCERACVCARKWRRETGDDASGRALSTLAAAER